MTETCSLCAKKLDARTKTAGGEVCFDCVTGVPKEPLQFRGRNGWVRYDSHRVVGLIGAGTNDTIVVELFSRRRGEYPPFVLLGERAEVRALLQQVIAEIDAGEATLPPHAAQKATA